MTNDTPSMRVARKVTEILYEIATVADQEERERIALELDKLNSVGVRETLADMAQRALKGTT